MIFPDTNLLIYGFRAEFPQHPRARAWWLGILQGTEPIAWHPLVACAFLRLTTKTLGPLPAAPFGEACAFLETLLRSPVLCRIQEGPRHAAILRQLCGRHRLAGDPVTDAWLAALAMEHNATLASADQDFARFSGLRWINPLAEDE